jgi:hypothetical protein
MIVGLVSVLVLLLAGLLAIVWAYKCFPKTLNALRLDEAFHVTSLDEKFRVENQRKVDDTIKKQHECAQAAAAALREILGTAYSHRDLEDAIQVSSVRTDREMRLIRLANANGFTIPKFDG